MSTSPETTPVPARILLATDLSARCDRALDRAAQLARDWHGELVALNVLDPAGQPQQVLSWIAGNDDDVVRFARQQLVRDLAGADCPVTMLIVRSADVAATVRDIATNHQCGLVVTGVARNEALGRFLLGSTVLSLARSLVQPLLVVRERPRGAYASIVVATDFSDSSRHALEAAARLFPGREFVLYHARPPLLSESDAGNGRHVAEQEIRARDFPAFMAGCHLPPGTAVRLEIGHGVLERVLSNYVHRQAVELVVMGTHGRNALVSTLLGSGASALLDWLPCDALVVRRTAQ